MNRRILVAHYSLSGNTADLAREIARELQADTETIRDARARRGVFGVLRSLMDAIFRREPSIAPVEKRPMDYDLLVLGGPIWAGRFASPVRTYARRHAGGANRIAFFCTQGGRGAETGMAELASICHLSPMTTLVVDGKHLKPAEHAAELARFVSSVRGPPAATTHASGSPKPAVR